MIKRLPENPELQRAIWTVIPDAPIGERRETLFNVIQPAYEPLWRGILSTFLEIRFVSGAQHPKWQDVLVDFLHNQTTEQFSLEVYEGDILVEDLIAEALHLHPPVPQILRAWMFMKPHPYIAPRIVADIAASDRWERVWGPNAYEFVPGQWTSSMKKHTEASLWGSSESLSCFLRVSGLGLLP